MDEETKLQIDPDRPIFKEYTIGWEMWTLPSLKTVLVFKYLETMEGERKRAEGKESEMLPEEDFRLIGEEIHYLPKSGEQEDDEETSRWQQGNVVERFDFTGKLAVKSIKDDDKCIRMALEYDMGHFGAGQATLRGSYFANVAVRSLNDRDPTVEYYRGHFHCQKATVKTEV